MLQGNPPNMAGFSCVYLECALLALEKRLALENVCGKMGL